MAALGYTRVFDLLLLLPLRYEDHTKVLPIVSLVHHIGKEVLVEGQISHRHVSGGAKPRLQLTLSDGGGWRLTLRFLHLYPRQEQVYKVGSHWRIFGELRTSYHGLEMVHPKSVRIDPDCPPPLATNLQPIYPKLKGISLLSHLNLMDVILAGDFITECLPDHLLRSFGLIPIKQALHTLHYPPAGVVLDRHHPAWRRLIFDELFAHQWVMHQQRKTWENSMSLPIGTACRWMNAVLGQLPFQLTDEQHRVIEEIRQDLKKQRPMRRLLQGDVGCGKTIVAAAAALLVLEHRQQVALMVPTEVLAIQHDARFKAWFESLKIPVYMLLGSQKRSERLQVSQALERGESCLVIGTHALFQEGVQFTHLNLVIIDEQHRFGVSQRTLLQEKADPNPHVLMMSATPIPRTLAMSYFADLDLSTIQTLPGGRQPVRTRLIRRTRLHDLLSFVKYFCDAGRQVYWVCPLIEDSEYVDLQNIEEAHQILCSSLPGQRIGLLHGKMKAHDKHTVMTAFAEHGIDILLATTVIEVGVDVPNACLMVIEHPERMGLAQLHQLRGRVGRGGDAGECVLFYETPLSEQAKARLKILYEHTDGFEIARQDLLLRGPGEFLGTRQSGIPQLRFAHLEGDQENLEHIRDFLAKHPQILQDSRMAYHAKRWYPSVASQV